jgi:PAS domain S-box-containing protein
LELVLDNIHNGVIITDADGYVIYFNKPYGQFLGIEADAQIGKHATEVIENTRMHIVAKTGEAEINKPHNIKGQNMVVQRIPIKRDGKVVAVFGQVMFKHVRDVDKLAKELSLLQSKLKMYEEELLSLRAERYTFDSILGTNPVIMSLKKEALRAAATNFPVLITGESGTGKEMFAQAIHNGSPRRLHPFIRINCASIPRDLLESELFGYEKGAFTGASPAGKYGKLELANKGTVFLDEIGDMPSEMQPKILRVLEEKEMERIGGTAPVKSDFRLIAASNQPMAEMVNDGRFRKDLYYRLNVIHFHIPPLRERRDDIITELRLAWQYQRTGKCAQPCDLPAGAGHHSALRHPFFSAVGQREAWRRCANLSRQRHGYSRKRRNHQRSGLQRQQQDRRRRPALHTQDASL